MKVHCKLLLLCLSLSLGLLLTGCPEDKKDRDDSKKNGSDGGITTKDDSDTSGSKDDESSEPSTKDDEKGTASQDGGDDTAIPETDEDIVYGNSTLGGACAKDTDCFPPLDGDLDPQTPGDEMTSACLPEVLSNQQTGFTGGYCIQHGCIIDQDPQAVSGCPPKSLCTEVTVGEQGETDTWCLPTCRKNDDCRGDQICQQLSNGSKVCWRPMCVEDKDCGDGFICNDGVCENNGTKTAELGAACKSSSDCNAKTDVCYTEEQGAVSGGYCSQPGCVTPTLLDPSRDTCKARDGQCIDYNATDPYLATGACFSTCQDGVQDCKADNAAFDGTCMPTPYGGVCLFIPGCRTHKDCIYQGQDSGARCVYDPAHPRYGECLHPVKGSALAGIATDSSTTTTGTTAVWNSFPTDAGGLAKDVKVGAACKDSNECGFQQECIPPTYQGQPTPWSGGVCIAGQCDDIVNKTNPLNPCPDGSACLGLFGDSYTACFATCSNPKVLTQTDPNPDQSDCRQDWLCVHSDLFSGNDLPANIPAQKGICLPKALLGL